jgi:predicted metal-dependent phosphoesterase TrpH
VDAARAIRAIKNAGGIAVWAHPLGGTGEKRLTKEQFAAQLRTLKEAGIAGLECYYSEYTAEESAMLRQAAMEQGLLVSGGSDYHGRNKKHLHLGMLNKDDAIVTEDKLSVLKLLR